MGNITFDNEFQLKYHKILMMNELGAPATENIDKSSYKLVQCPKGNSGYSFGPCQWDLSNPDRVIKGELKIEDLFQKILYKEINNGNVVDIIIDNVYYKKKAGLSLLNKDKYYRIF